MTDVHRRFTDAVNRHDAEAFAELYAPNAIVHDPSYEQPLEGREAIRREMETFFRSFPDLRASIRSHVESDGITAFDGTFEGTHNGPLALGNGEVPATGRNVRFNAAGFYRMDDSGRVVEERRYYDLAGMLTQLGVIDDTGR